MSDLPDFAPLMVDVVLRPEWAAVKATDKLFSGLSANINPDTLYTPTLYTVPSGKTLYLTGWETGLRNATGTLMGYLLYENAVQILAILGGNQGAAASFTPPKTLPANAILVIGLIHYAASASKFYFAVRGYEL